MVKEQIANTIAGLKKTIFDELKEKEHKIFDELKKEKKINDELKKELKKAKEESKTES
jgi:FtsZ-binding cell division protein ZapB